MAAIDDEEHRQGVRRRLRSGQRRQHRRRRRRVRDPRRAVGLREVDAAADDRRARGHHVRRHDHRRRAGQRQGAARAQPVDGVPELRPLPAPHRVREHRLPAAPVEEVRASKRSTRRSARRPARSSSTSTSIASRPTCPAASASGWRWAGPSSATAKAFLFDEPLSNLDAKLRGQMRTEIARMQRRLGITTVYVTHDQTEAMTLGDRVAVLQQGFAPAARLAARAVRAAGQPVRRRVHRLAADELPAGDGEGDKVELPFVTVDLPEHARGKVPARNLADRRHPPRSTSRTPPWSTSRGGQVGATFRATVDVTEWLGNEAVRLHALRGAAGGGRSQLKDLARELDSESLRTQLIVSLDPASRVREGEEAESVRHAARCTCSTRRPATTSPSRRQRRRG